MRKLKISFLAFIVIGFVTVFYGCKKTYTTVVQGGGDSVKTSGWLPISDTLYTDNNNDTIYQETFTSNAITSAAVNSGVVLAYLGVEESTGDTLSELPSELGVFTSYGVGSVTIDSYPQDDGGGGDVSTINTGYYFRYVLVPGSVLTANNLTKLQAKSMSFAEVTKLTSTPKQSSDPSIIPQ